MNTTEKLYHEHIKPALYFHYSRDSQLTTGLLKDLQLWYNRKHIQGCWLLQEIPRIR